MAEDFLSSLPELRCFREYADPPEIIPGRAERGWMDATTQHFAYRCTPLSIANTSGWELILPGSFSATWHGGHLVSDVVIKPTSEHLKLGPIVESVLRSRHYYVSSRLSFSHVARVGADCARCT